MISIKVLSKENDVMRIKVIHYLIFSFIQDVLLRIQTKGVFFYGHPV